MYVPRQLLWGDIDPPVPGPLHLLSRITLSLVHFLECMKKDIPVRTAVVVIQPSVTRKALVKTMLSLVLLIVGT